MAPQATYSISGIDAIKAISPDDRTDGYCRISRDNDNWYIFKALSTASPDNFNVLMPSDEPANGRWHKTNNNVNLPGVITCQDECSLGGKVFEFFGNFKGNIIVNPSSRIGISEDYREEYFYYDERQEQDIYVDKSIEIHRWNQPPNKDLIGREWYSFVPYTGGIVNLEIDDIYRWVSIFVRNPDGTPDGCCFRVSDNVFNLIDYGGGSTAPLEAVVASKDSCTIGGKALKFFNKSKVKVEIKPSSGIEISTFFKQDFDSGNATEDLSIEVRLFDDDPVSGGSNVVGYLPIAGGSLEIEITNNLQWLSVLPANPANSDQYDFACITFSGNVITIIDFSTTQP